MVHSKTSSRLLQVLRSSLRAQHRSTRPRRRSVVRFGEQLEERIVLEGNRPVLDPSASPVMVSVAENAGAPTGAVGTLVSSLIDAGGTHNNFSDSDGDLPGIAITAVNLAAGTLWYTENDGTSWQQVGSVSDASPQLIAADTSSRLYFQPDTNFHGTISDLITFRAWDRTHLSQQLQLGSDIEAEADDDEAGYSVALSADGRTVAIGAPRNNSPGGNNNGHVRIYQWNGTAWQQLGSDIDGEAISDLSGFCVSLSSNGATVAIGAPSNDGNSENGGHVRVFEWTGTDWQQLGADIDGEGTGSENSGYSVGLSGDGRTVAIGGPGNSESAANAGQTRVFRWNGSGWIKMGTDINGEGAGDYSGWSVALSTSGTRLAVAAPGDDDNGRNSGNVRVYRWTGTEWQQQGLDIDGEGIGDSSEYLAAVSISSDGNTVAIGMPYNDGNGLDSGHVRVYEWSGATWEQVGNDLDGENAGDKSGFAVSLSSDGKSVAIGAPYNDDNGNDSGHARVYDWDGAVWQLRDADIDGVASRDHSGISVALSASSDTLAIGAPSHGATTTNNGHVRIFSLTAASASVLTDAVSIFVNAQPTIDGIADLTISEDASTQLISLSGITAGSSDSQTIRVTASSSDTSLIPHPQVTYTSEDASGTISFRPVPDNSGTATVTVTVEDAGADGDFATSEDNASTTQSFNVTVAEQFDVDIESHVKLASNLNGVPAIASNMWYHAPARIGDFDGDGVDDLAVSTIGPSGQLRPGTVYIHRMNSDGTVRETTSFTVDSPNFGVDVSAIGDVDADGVIDLVVGANDADGSRGAVFICFLNANGTLKNSVKIGNNLNGGPSLGSSTVFGTSVAGTGDIDNDGIPDIVVGANNYGYPANKGAAFVCLLNSDGTARSVVRLSDGANGIPAGTLSNGDSLGYRVEGIGDLNNDGIPDIAVPAVNDGATGALYIFFLSGTGTVSGMRKLESGVDGVPDLTSQQFGRGIAVVDDLDGNGIVELVVGSPWDDTAGTDRGAVYVLYMESDGTVGSYTKIANDLHGGPPLTDSDHFGDRIAAIGDLDNNGAVDIAILARGDNTSANNQGAIYVAFLSAVNPKPTLDALTDVSINENSGEYSRALTGITAGLGDSQPLRVTATSSASGVVTAPSVTYTSPDASGSLAFTPVADASGSVTITVTVEDGGLDANLDTLADNATYSRTFDVFVNATPTLDVIENVTIDEDAPEQLVTLAGITAGATDVQPLRVTVTSSNTSLIPAPSVTYTSAETTGNLTFTPIADQWGTATITVRVEDGGQDGDLETIADNAIALRTFEVTVNAVNDQPTLNSIVDLTMEEDSAEQVINLTGITAGGGELQSLRITATSDNTNLVRFAPGAPQLLHSLSAASIGINTEIQGDRIYAHVVAGNGSVASWNIDDSGNLITRATINSPHTTYGEPTFGESIIANGNFLGIGSRYTWVNATHDGRFYIYNSVGNELNQTLNPAPHKAQYFGIKSAMSTGFFAVMENGNGTHNTKGGVTVYRFDGSTLATTQVHRQVFPSATNSSCFGIGEGLAASPDYLASLTQLLNEQENVIRLWKVVRDVQGNVTEVVPGSELTIPGITGKNIAIYGNTVAVSFNNGDAFGGTVQLFRADSQGSLTPIGTIAQPTDASFSNSSFGASIALDRDQLFVGAPDAVNGTAGTGIVLAYDLTKPGILDSYFTVEPPSAKSGDRFGQRLILRDGRLAVTAATDNVVLYNSEADDAENVGDFSFVNYSSPESSGLIRLLPASNESGAATLTVTIEDGGIDNDIATPADNGVFQRSFVVNVAAINDDPEIDAIDSFSVNEDAGEVTVELTGISAGGRETQPLQVTATSSASGVVTDPSVTYTSPDASGSLAFTPVADASGSVTITVTVEDGGLDANLDTLADNATYSRTFDVFVNATPTLDVIENVTIDEDAPEQLVTLAGITAGATDVQPLRVTVTSSNTSLIPAPSVTYTSAETTGNLTFTPIADQWGTATITVRVEDGGRDGDLETIADNATVIRTFEVTVNAVNDQPTLNNLVDLRLEEQDFFDTTVQLAGISAGGGETQQLKVTAASSDSSVVRISDVSYVSPDPSGTLTMTLAPESNGTATISVIIQDGGLDNDLLTTSDNAEVVKTFVVTIEPVAPVITGPDGTSEQRPRINWTPISAAASYRVWISQNSQSINPLITGFSAEPFFDVPTALGNGKIDVWVRGVRENGQLLPWSAMHRFVVGTAPVVEDVPDRQTTAKPTITWSDVPGAESYDVYVNNLSSGQREYVRQSVSGTQWIPDHDLPMARYHFWVRAITPDGLGSPWSSRESFYIAPAPEVITPVLPTFDRTPTFDFGDISGATSYSVFVRSLVDGTTAANVSGLSTSEWTPDENMGEGRYAWWAIADSTVAGFRSSWSRRTEFYVGGLTTITGPSSPAGSVTPQIQWLAVGGADHYVLQVNGDVEGPKLIYRTDITSNSFQVTAPFGSGRTYRAWVKAVSTTGEHGPWTSAWEFTIADTAEEDLLTVPIDAPISALLPQQFDHSGTRVQRVATADPKIGLRPAAFTLLLSQEDAAKSETFEVQTRRMFEHAVSADWLEELMELGSI